ncbi:MAG: TrkH family potassium uptake protein [Pseudomonadota bacterium]
MRISDLNGHSIGLPAPALLALLYAALACAGATLLKLPFAAITEISWSDALFTAISAITVTGLVVVDTGSELTFFGQAVVAILIQLGGLGLMTFATLVLSSLGLPIGFEHRMFLREDLGQTSLDELLTLVKIILRVVILCEGVGALLLAFVTVPEFGLAEGLWQAVFHSISAFNNAGFALFPDSLTRWATDPIVNLTIPALFIIGGLGFGVLWDMARQRRWSDLSLHSKLMLVGTTGLIIWAFFLFAWLEWDNPATLGLQSGIGDKLWVSWFQATTPRTAGFNTADIAGVHDSTVMLFLSLMFIGGGSTSTAGGIKVTTFIVLLLATYAFFRRRPRMRAFGRSLGFEEALKVMALLTIAGVIVVTGIFLVTLTHDGEFIDLVFEVVSAFGTVGLSRGSTGELDTMGRVTIMVLMFLGRVGPLTLGVFLATSTPTRIRYPSSKVYLG